ncbi:unnamed protein product [Blepharisma stoltei]|uniref:BK channel n=1 Tax=Blepharisma stoltei TaxID=1481888 RepID=A0AAU9J7M9_9CILI|nr:unnamed protein product [Blepharisma stoltei]
MVSLKGKDEKIQQRLLEAFNPLNESKILKGPLIDPLNCEIINQCGLSSMMLEAYYRHVEYMKASVGAKNLKSAITQNALRFYRDLFEVTITIIACMLYVIGTYYEDSHADLFQVIDTIVATIFLMDWIWQFFYAQNRVEYAFSKMSMVDLLTIIPVYVELILFGFHFNLNFLRALRILRIVRVLRMFKALNEKEEVDGKQFLSSAVDVSGFNKQVLILIISIFSVIFIGAGLANGLNSLQSDSFKLNAGEFDFLTALYYTIVTTSTVGYGDIFPQRTASRMAILFMILAMAFILSDQLSKMSQLVSNYSKYDRKYHLVDHIIIGGYYTPSSIYQFLSQFYHQDHGKNNHRCVIIGSNYPSDDILKLINSSKYEEKICYLEGDISNPATLEKANAHMADSIFILTNQHSPHPDAADINATIVTKMIKHYYPYSHTYLQLVKNHPDSTMDYSPWHTVISIQDIKMSILGMSVYNKGFSTVITSLYTTSNSKVPKGLEASWLHKATQGIGKEVYCVQASEFFFGKMFYDVVKFVYKNINGILVIGVKSKYSKDNKGVIINPCNYRIANGDMLFVIADNQKAAGYISSYFSTDENYEESENSNRLSALEQAFLGMKLKDNTYKSMLEKGKIYSLWKDNLNGLVSHHIIVIGDIEGFPNIVKALRSYSYQPICLINNSEPSSEWAKITDLCPNLYYFKGNMLNHQDLYMAAISDCRCVVILTQTDKNNSSLDSKAILCSRLIDVSFPNTQILVELSDENSVKFLSNRPQGEFSKMHYYTWPQHLSGGCFFANYLDSLICQIFYNPDLSLILNKLIGFGTYEKEYQENSKIHTIKIPTSYFQGKNSCSYQQILIDFLEMKPPIIPLAVISRRNTTDIYTPGEVLYINPTHSTTIRPLDSIICIGGSSLDSRKESLRSDGSTGPESIGVKSISIESEKADENKDVINLLIESLKHRLNSDWYFKNKIEWKAMSIHNLQKEVEDLKCDLIEKA